MSRLKRLLRVATPSTRMLTGGDAEVVVAFGTDLVIPQDLLLVDDLLAAVTLHPQPLGHLHPLVLQGNLGRLLFAEPGHVGYDGRATSRPGMVAANPGRRQ